MKYKLLFVVCILFSISCENNSSKEKAKTFKSVTGVGYDTIQPKRNSNYHLRKVKIEENSSKNDNSYNNFLFVTKDTIIKNVFTDENVTTELIKEIQIFKDKKQVQEINEINEIILFSSEEKKEGSIKLEDKNKDGFLDLWIEFSPFSRDYDSDYMIFLFDQKKGVFSNKREYLIKNLTAEEFKKRYAPEHE